MDESTVPSKETTMVKDSMDLLELLPNRGVDGDVDLLREALRMLMDAIMDASRYQRGSALSTVSAVPVD